jgi:hypothetical protein
VLEHPTGLLRNWKPMTELNTTEEKTTESNIEKRAHWEAFEFRVPCEARVRVENVSHGDESDEHVHVVTVKGGKTTGCTCKFDQYNVEKCKHRVATEDRPAVISAADPAIEIETEETEITPETTQQQPVVADGGQIIEVEDTNEPYDADDDDKCVCDTATNSDLSCFEHFDPNDESTEDTEDTEDTPTIVTDGGQQLTKLANEQVFTDNTGTRWEIEQRVEQVDLVGNGEEVPCVRLGEIDGEGRKWIGCRRFPKMVNDPDGEFTLVDNITGDENECRTLRRSEPADFGGGESTGVQDL